MLTFSSEILSELRLSSDGANLYISTLGTSYLQPHMAPLNEPESFAWTQATRTSLLSAG